MKEWPTAVVKINKHDAATLGIAQGNLVKVSAKAGSVDLIAQVTEEIRPGVVSMPANIAGGIRET